MDRAQEFVDEFLAHYDYDPVKAHEYYLRTRELKGRRSASDLATPEKKETWSYVKGQISEQKKAELADAAVNYKAQLTDIRNSAHAKRQEISDGLSFLLQAITEKYKGTGKRRRGKSAKAARERIAEQVKEEKEAVREDARAERQQIADDLKVSVENARAEYQALKEELKNKYEQSSDQEYQNIQQD